MKINKDKIVNKVKDVSKYTLNKGKQLFNNLKEDYYFISNSELVKVSINNDDKFNRYMFALIDLNKEVIYIKEDNYLYKNKKLNKGVCIKLKDNNIYEIIKVNHNKQDYLLDTNKNKNAISIYEISIKKVI